MKYTPYLLSCYRDLLEKATGAGRSPELNSYWRLVVVAAAAVVVIVSGWVSLIS